MLPISINCGVINFELSVNSGRLAGCPYDMLLGAIFMCIDWVADIRRQTLDKLALAVNLSVLIVLILIVGFTLLV